MADSSPGFLKMDGLGVHYKGFEELYGKDLQSQHVPSNNQKKGGSGGGTNNSAKHYVNCHLCNKPRVLFANKKAPWEGRTQIPGN